VLYVKIPLERCVILLTPAELRKLLATDPELWKVAIGRGKGLKRYESMKAREKAIQVHDMETR